MSPEKLDLLFPYVLLTYGATMTFVLNLPVLMELAETRLPSAVVQQMNAHRLLSLFCLIGGALWTLQNLWL